MLVVKRLEDDKIELKRLLNNATLERRELQRNTCLRWELQRPDATCEKYVVPPARGIKQ